METPANIDRDDLVCPNCQYSLRGLPGDIVSCPECGNPCDIAKLMVRRWIGPWYRAPGFQWLVLPVMWLFLPLLLVILLMVVVMAALGVTWNPQVEALVKKVLMVGVFVILIGWFPCFIPAHRYFGGIRGVQLALLAHAVFLGFAIGLFGAVAWAIIPRGLVNGVLDYLMFTAVSVPAGITLLLACRRGDKWLAEQCIRRYLQRLG